MNATLTKSYAAGAAIAAFRFCKIGSADFSAIQATDASVAILGVSERIGADSGSPVDVIKGGIAKLELGGAVTRGDLLIPDANGKGVAGSTVSGAAQFVGAIAEQSGVSGDIIDVLVVPGAVINNPTSVVTVDVTVSTAELLALNATPKQLIAAPGSGKAIIVEDAQLMLDYNSIAYAGIAAGEDLEIRYTDGSGALVATVEATGFLDQAADEYRHVRPTTTAALEPVTNAALVIRMATGEIITGNSPLKVRVRYRTVDVAW
jgi:hypothetical protein